MNTLALIITCIAGAFAFAFLLAGYVALLSQDQSEIDDFQRRYSELTSRGIAGYFKRLRWVRREALPISQIVSRWRTRPEVRRLIWVGLLALAVALISGHFSSLPK